LYILKNELLSADDDMLEKLLDELDDQEDVGT